MKVLPFKISKPSNKAIVFQVDSGVFYERLHQHEELQISLIKSGSGTLIVGDGIYHYKTGDVLVLGGQLPHVFRNEHPAALMHSIFFSPDSFGRDFLDLEEGKGVLDFSAFAKAGFHLTASQKILELFEALSTAKGIQLLHLFLQLLESLNKSDVSPLSTFVYSKKISEADGKKLHSIFEYSLEHFMDEMRLGTIAKVAAMSPNAFCKYFKKRTNKTYFQFITELRIGYACKILREEKDISIAEIAENSGFQTLSHFNRTFRKIKECTPSAYRNT